MLVILRIIFGAAMYWAFKEAQMNAQVNPLAGDVANGFWVAVVVILALANAMVWAPYFGEKVAAPLTGATVDAEYKEPRSILLKMIRRCETSGQKSAAAMLSFVQGVRTPYLPTPFVIGMRNAAEGSWLQKVFAKEVFKFNNSQNCLVAFKILQKHGIDPRPHASPGVNLALHSGEQEVKPPPATVPVPEAPPPPKLERNKRIDIGEE